MNGQPFAASGEFRGFVTSAEGKRRAVLRIDGTDVAFKLPKELRRRYEDQLAVGQTLQVEGREHIDEFTGREKRVIERLRITSSAPTAAPCAGCTIRICTKKNCWHSGGRALWRHLEETIAARGLGGVVRLESIRCLDHCKHAPVLAIGRQCHVDCDRETADRLLKTLL
jgi:hypothetical protein